MDNHVLEHKCIQSLKTIEPMILLYLISCIFVAMHVRRKHLLVPQIISSISKFCV